MGKKPPEDEISILLDQFTDSDLRQWQKISDLDEKYNVMLAFHLQALRRMKHDKLVEALSSKSSIEVKKRGWYRLVGAQYTLEPLSTKGSLIKGGRFNVGSDLVDLGTFPALYIGENYDVSEAEYLGINKTHTELEAHEYALRSRGSFSAYQLNINLSNVFDLRKANTLKSFTKIVSKFEITEELKTMAEKLGQSPPYIVQKPKDLHATLLASNWRKYPVQYEIQANSQIFGRLLIDAGYEGALYPSARYHGKNCLAVFPQNLAQSDSYIELQDKVSQDVKFRRLDAETWEALTE